MGKLEELTELLVDEINDFKTSVEILEKINNQLHDVKIQMDLTEYKSIVEEHQKQMQSHLNEIKHFENRFNKKIKEAKIYPTWAVVVFITSILMGTIFVIYVLFEKKAL